MCKYLYQGGSMRIYVCIRVGLSQSSCVGRCVYIYYLCGVRHAYVGMCADKCICMRGDIKRIDKTDKTSEKSG